MSEAAANLQQYLTSSSLLAYPAAFVAGLFISLTPCVYPVIPIQLGFISGQTLSAPKSGRSISLHGFTLSVLFVIGMATVYAALGAFASLTGTLFGRWAASPWVYIIVANIVLAMALSMLDVFQFTAPQFLTRWNPKRRGRGYLSALFVGASSGLVVGPCTSPALGAVLALVGTKGNVFFGTLLLFTFALGMGALMIVLGTFSGALAAMPRSGLWMVKAKKAFGVLMLLIAEYLLLQAGQRSV